MTWAELSVEDHVRPASGQHEAGLGLAGDGGQRLETQMPTLAASGMVRPICTSAGHGRMHRVRSDLRTGQDRRWTRRPPIPQPAAYRRHPQPKPNLAVRHCRRMRVRGAMTAAVVHEPPH